MSRDEIRRKWEEFVRDMRTNSWYRGRLISFLVLGMLLAYNLTIFMFGCSTKAIVCGAILGVTYFVWYEKSYRMMNGSVLMRPKFGLPRDCNYMMAPNLTILLMSIIELAWARFDGYWWNWIFLAWEVLYFRRVIRGIRYAIKILTEHEYYVSSAYGFLRAADSLVDPHERAIEILRNWVRKTIGEDAEINHDTDHPPG